MTSTSRTARCGPACRVVWEGSARNMAAPIPIKPDDYHADADLYPMGFSSNRRDTTDAERVSIGKDKGQL